MRLDKTGKSDKIVNTKKIVNMKKTERGVSKIMKIEIDTHSHTIVSGHAYNTIREMAAMAKEKGLRGLAITEHAPKMPGSTHLYYFQNLRVVPREMYGVELLMGVELNIMDEEGTVDLPEKEIKQLDISIASLHTPCYAGEREEAAITRTLIKVMENDCVDIIGHPDDGRFPVDYDVLARVAKETGTLLEVNNGSLRPGGFRINSKENAIKMLECCKKYNTMVVLGTDSHVDVSIADYTYVNEVLEAADFPEELVANTSLEKLKSALKRNR